MLFEIHMLKNYPPVNLNRDDSGAPKSCLFGGEMRGRISSQCLKRSWRRSEIFREEMGEKYFGIRTRQLPDEIGKRLKAKGVETSVVEVLGPILAKIGKDKKKSDEEQTNKKKDAKEKPKTQQLIFYSLEDLDSITNEVLTLVQNKEKKDIKKIDIEDLRKALESKSCPVSLDIALFGRMVTDDAIRNIEASMQVAHAISTNKTTVESDYYTAMDDLLDGRAMEDQGAAMIGDVDYNSSCYYIYASIDTDALQKNLKDVKNAEEIIKKAIPALLRTMAFTNPSGKQNSFAGHILPSAIMIECKESKIPTSMVNAFVKPVKGADIVAESIRKLAEEIDMVARNYEIPIKSRMWFCVDKYDIRPGSITIPCSTFNELVNNVCDMLK